MQRKLFVGNLPWSTTDEELQGLFSSFGEIEEAVVIRDKFTNRSRGFGFVTFAEQDGLEAIIEKAVEEMNGHDMNGRPLTVNVARPPREA